MKQNTERGEKRERKQKINHQIGELRKTRRLHLDKLPRKKEKEASKSYNNDNKWRNEILIIFLRVKAAHSIILGPTRKTIAEEEMKTLLRWKIAIW